MDDFPVPIRFDLPDARWRAVRPDALGVRGARFLALRDGTPGGYTPTISVAGGWRTDDATIERIADEAVLLLREETPDARLLDRRTAGTEHVPGCSQTVGATLEVDGRRLAITRLQAVLGFVDADVPGRRAVLIVSCTSLADQAELVRPEFGRMVSGLRVDDGRRAGG